MWRVCCLPPLLEPVLVLAQSKRASFRHVVDGSVHFVCYNLCRTPTGGAIRTEARCTHLAGILETATSALFDERRQVVNTLVRVMLCCNVQLMLYTLMVDFCLKSCFVHRDSCWHLGILWRTKVIVGTDRPSVRAPGRNWSLRKKILPCMRPSWWGT